jgi:STE24 endopeptidase
VKIIGAINKTWLHALFLATGVFALLYLWFTLFPGAVKPQAFTFFQEQQIIEGRNYLFVHRLVFIISFLLELTVLGWLVYSGKAEACSKHLCTLTGSGKWGGRLLFFLILWLLFRLIHLPFQLIAGYWWEKRWGFLTQSLPSWWQDYFLSAGLDFVLSLGAVILLFAAMERWPRGWWLAGAGFTAVWLFVQTLLWPVVVSPLFNDFKPVPDPEVKQMVKGLSEKAGLEVGEVLVMDASRRTTTANAYFTGLGRTKRIVLYDTLLRNYPPQEVKAVIAHEMAHWKHGHIIKGILGGILGNFLLWALLFLFLKPVWEKTAFYPPYTLALLLLFVLPVSFLSRPLENYVSRQMELQADRTAVVLTGDVPGAVQLQIDLAARNLADVSPPAFLEWFSYSHPSSLVRIESILTIDPDSSIILEETN